LRHGDLCRVILSVWNFETIDNQTDKLTNFIGQYLWIEPSEKKRNRNKGTFP